MNIADGFTTVTDCSGSSARHRASSVGSGTVTFDGPLTGGIEVATASAATLRMTGTALAQRRHRRDGRRHAAGGRHAQRSDHPAVDGHLERYRHRSATSPRESGSSVRPGWCRLGILTVDDIMFGRAAACARDQRHAPPAAVTIAWRRPARRFSRSVTLTTSRGYTPVAGRHVHGLDATWPAHPVRSPERPQRRRLRSRPGLQHDRPLRRRERRRHDADRRRHAHRVGDHR